VPALVPPRRTEFVTSQAAEAREFLDRGFGGRLLVTANRDSDWRISITQVEVGDVAVSEMTLPADLRYQTEGRDDFVFDTMLDGVIVHHRGKETVCYRPGDVFLSTFPGAGFASRSSNARAHVVRLPRSLLADLAGVAPGQPGAKLEFRSQRPTGGGGARQWQRAARYVDEVLADPDASASPLVVGPAVRLLAASALAIFPNTAVSGPTAADRRDAHPDALRRAVAFIDEHAHEDITSADIAAAAHVTIRAVEMAFRRHLDTTPLRYLRSVRLERAHRQLQAADPARQTVTAVAYQWGFSSASRFARYYHDAYGTLPSRTLHG
jgi:AraC-like DNA-binding protein